MDLNELKERLEKDKIEIEIERRRQERLKGRLEKLGFSSTKEAENALSSLLNELESLNKREKQAIELASKLLDEMDG